MRDQNASQTAIMVALLRALADEGFTTCTGFRDPFAAKLLPHGWAFFHSIARRGLSRATPERRRAAARQIDPIPLRALAIDEELQRALTSGCSQVVILGAGLDMRAYRLPTIGAAHVWEVDHPQTQTFKKRMIAGLRPLSRALAMVPVNFEHDSLTEKLSAAGLDPQVPTVWIWEGVVMYLTDAAFLSTLRAMASLSAPGSTVLVHYHEPVSQRSRETVTERLLLRFWKEPQIGQRRREAMATGLTDAGFAVTGDAGHAEWCAMFGADAPTTATALQSRLMVGTRR